MDWLNLLALLLLSAGHAQIMIAAINRVHSLRLGEQVVKQARHVHDLMIAGFPVVALWQIGWEGPGLLRGGGWSELPLGWISYLSMCALGLLGLAYGTVRHLRYRPPPHQVSHHTERRDIAAELGRRPLGDGPHQFLCAIPRNECFQLEVAEKTFRLPGLPPEWAGLSILHLTDLHLIGTVDRPYYERVAAIGRDQAADMIVFTGDLLDNQDLVAWLPDTLGALKAPLGCYSILGNHDWFLDPGAIRRRLADLGWMDVAGKAIQIEHRGCRMALAGSETPWMNDDPDYADVDADFRLLLSHTPDNFGWARRQGVDLMLSGHNHGGQIRLPLVGPVYSPSMHGVRFASGTFWEPPTLLHVSRGIAGKQPIRLNCLPELVKLILQPQPND